MGMKLKNDDAGTGIDGFEAYLRVDRVTVDRTDNFAVVRVSAFGSEKSAKNGGKRIGEPREYHVMDTLPIAVEVEQPSIETLTEPGTHYVMSEAVTDYTDYFSVEALAKTKGDLYGQAYRYLKERHAAYKESERV